MIGNLKIALKFILIIVLPFFFITITNFFVAPTVTFKWAIALIVFGILWSAVSSAYLILDGHGTPFKEKPPKKLVTSGPYSMSKHPIYFGFMIYTLGLSLYFNPFSLWIWALLVILIVIHALIEDKSIIKKFQDAEYEKSTPLLLPIKKWKVNPIIEPPFLYAFMFLVGKFIVPFFFDVRISGREKIPEGPYVVISNHTSYPDPLFVIDALNSYVRFPITSAHYEKFAWFFDRVGMFPIKRYTVDVPAIMKFTKTMKSGGIIGIFPEGERNWDGRPLEIPEGVVRLLKMSPNPILPMRIDDAHLLWPRWAKTLKKGVVRVEIGDPVDPKDYQKAFDYVFFDTFKDEIYASYVGIEKYVWKCPSCKTIGTIKSFKDGFKCDKCASQWSMPKVGEVRRLHDSIEISTEDLPLSDDAIVNGKKSKIVLYESKMEIGDKQFLLSEIQSFLVESNKIIYIFTGELFVIQPLNTSLLMWKEYFDVLRKM